jgi:hypothetical protein
MHWTLFKLAKSLKILDTYEFMKLVMVVCEDHYQQGDSVCQREKLSPVMSRV